MPIVNATEFAQWHGKTNQWVTKLIAEGMPVVKLGENGESHEIDSSAAEKWRTDRWKAKASGEGRLKKAQADRVEFENAIRRDEFIPIELHGELLRRVAGEVAGQMSGFPGRVAPKIAGIKDPALVRARLIDECNDVRSAVANIFGDFADSLGESAQPIQSSAGNCESATEDDA